MATRAEAMGLSKLFIVSKLGSPFRRTMDEQGRRLNFIYSAINTFESNNTLELVSEILAERELALDLLLYFSDILEINSNQNISVLFPLSLAFTFGKLKGSETVKPKQKDTTPNYEERSRQLADRRRLRETNCHASALLYCPNGIKIEELQKIIETKQLNGLYKIEITLPTSDIINKLGLSASFNLLADNSIIEVELKSSEEDARKSLDRYGTKLFLEGILGENIFTAKPTPQQTELNPASPGPDKYYLHINSDEQWKIRAALRVWKEQIDLDNILEGLEKTKNATITPPTNENENFSVTSASPATKPKSNTFSPPLVEDRNDEETNGEPNEIPDTSNLHALNTYTFLIKIHFTLWTQMQNDRAGLDHLETHYRLYVRPTDTGRTGSYLQIKGTVIAMSNEDSDKVMSLFITKVLQPAAEKISKAHPDLPKVLYSVIQRVEKSLEQGSNKGSQSQIPQHLTEHSSNLDNQRNEQGTSIRKPNLLESEDNHLYDEQRIVISKEAYDEAMGWYFYLINRIKENDQISIKVEDIIPSDYSIAEQRKVAIVCEPENPGAISKNPDVVFHLKDFFEQIEELLSKEFTTTKNDYGICFWLRTDLSDYIWTMGNTNVKLIEKQNDGKFTRGNRGLLTFHEFSNPNKTENAIRDLQNLAIMEASQLQLHFIRTHNIKREEVIQALRKLQSQVFLVNKFVEKGSNLLMSNLPLNIYDLTRILENKVEMERSILANKVTNKFIAQSDTSVSKSESTQASTVAANILASRSTEVSQTIASESIKLESDFYNYINLCYKAEIDNILGKRYSIYIQGRENSPKQLVFLNISPPNKEYLLKIDRFVQMTIKNSTKVNISIPAALESIPEDVLKALILKDIDTQKKSSASNYKLKFYISSFSLPNLIILIDNRDCQVVKVFIRTILRKLVCTSIPQNLNISKYFTPLDSVHQFCIKGKENIKFFVYSADLTQIPVSAVVSSSDAELCFKGGAASALLKEAGNELLIFCQDYLRSKNIKGIPEMSCWTSPGFGLPADYIIHAATPLIVWDSGITNQYNYSLTHTPTKTSVNNLTNTLKNTLMEASRMQLYSIAIPLLGAGKASGEVKEAKNSCSVILLKGFVEAFNNSSLRDTSLREIHVVNIDSTVTAVILETLKSLCSQNIYQFFGKSNIYTVTKGAKPFAPAQTPGMTQPQTGNKQPLNLGQPTINSPSLPKLLSEQRGMSPSSTGLYPQHSLPGNLSPSGSSYSGQVSQSSPHPNTGSHPGTASPGFSSLAASTVAPASVTSTAPRFKGPTRDETSNWMNYYIEESSQYKYYQDRNGQYYYYYHLPTKICYYYDPTSNTKFYWDDINKKRIYC